MSRKSLRCAGCGRFMGWNATRARWECVCGITLTPEQAAPIMATLRDAAKKEAS